MHYRMRVAAFAMLYMVASLQMLPRGQQPWVWTVLGLVFLGYPHLQYWRTCRAEDPVAAELSHLLLDSVLVGVFVGAVEFSLWLSFAAMLGTLINNVTNRGWPGAAETMLGFLIGAGAWIAINGLNLSPQSDWPVALACVVGLGCYLLVLSHSGFVRNKQLRSTREALRRREKEVLSANETLVNNLREIEELQQQVQAQADHDPLTNLYNRRYLNNMLDWELARCQRDGKPLAFLMVDVDYFKKFNDCYGHQAGDECLKSVAATLQENAKRATDLAARYGGEEFSVILADTNVANAQRLAERIRRDVEQLNVPHKHSRAGVVTISVGVAVMTEHSYPDVQGLIRAADEAVYRAKHAGRNQVQVATPTPDHASAPLLA